MARHRRHALRRAAVVVVPLAGLLGCSPAVSRSGAGSSTTTAARRPAARYPVTLHAANGTVTLAARPTAIVSLSPTATEMLYAIGAGPQVKAVDESSDYPKGTPMTKLDGLDPNVEAIASYQPDLVVVSDDPTSLNAQLKALGVPVLSEPAADDLAQEYHQIDQLGAATGHAPTARREVEQLEHEVSAVVRATPKPAHPETYYYELTPTHYSATSSTFIGRVLGRLGLKSIADAAHGAAASGGYPQLSAEHILQANPDYIFLADTTCCGQSQATVATRPGWARLGAVRDHRVLGLNDDIASRWGPRIVDLLRDVSEELRRHPVARS
ncbi:MAG: ABC transporter substrate-binding protein [Acidimicrobiales bacterium]